MQWIVPWCFSVITVVALANGTVAPPDPAKGRWAANGTLLEACTCVVPCSCNFGEPPSPNGYCHAVYAYRLEKAAWDGVDLSGLVIAGADGPKGGACFLDARATAAQRPALRRLARAVWAQGGPGNAPDMPFSFASITPSVNGNDLQLKIGDAGGFAARVIVGRDGKTPVVVENNTVWPIARAIKGKTSRLDFRDKNVGAISASGTNANHGAFAFGGASSAVAKKPVAAGGACCGTHGVK